MAETRYASLIAELEKEYTQRFARSAQSDVRANKVLVDGATHMARYYAPFPFRCQAAKGAYVWDVDGHQILDFWQGHYANILGHNPPEVTAPLSAALADRWGLQTGFADELEEEVGTLITRQTGAERVRFTTSGTLATMYAIMLARAYTNKPYILKVGGGWHGGQPWALKGVSYKSDAYSHLESEGLPRGVEGEVMLTRFNDTEELTTIFRQNGDRIACFILEPWVGSGGYIGATPEYLRAARELTAKYGAVLILDEVIAGFRFRAGNLAALYGVQPDLMTLGKIAGGGMPLAAVAGRLDVMRLASRMGGRRVRFDGGTYSAHPATLLAAKVMINYLVSHEAEIYPYIAALGEKARRGIEQAFAIHGIAARCTGDANAMVPGSSLAGVQFPINGKDVLDCPEDTQNPAKCDIALRERVLKLGLLLQDVNVAHGLGAVSTAHTEADINRLIAAVEAVAARVARA